MRGTGPAKLPRDACAPPSWNPAKEREVVDAKPNVMQANLPKKFHRARGRAVTVEKQVFIKLSNSFAGLDRCTDRSVHFYEGCLSGLQSDTITSHHGLYGRK